MKKFVYIFSWIILGGLLSFVAHAFLEIWYIDFILKKGGVPIDYSFLGHWCALPALLQWGILAFGIAGGYFLGFYFWKVIYVEKRYCKTK